MSRADLDGIQLQLKTAIQSHQTLVSKMKSDPQDVELRKQLHDLQKEIFVLSEKQKGIVQSLRKELVSREKQNKQNTQQLLQQQPIVQPPVQQPPQQQGQPPSNTVVLKQPAKPKPMIENIPPKQGSGSVVQSKPISSVEIASKLTTTTLTNAPPKSTSPPIRVPQYSAHRPSILQSTKSNVTKTFQPAAPLSRKTSDSDGKEPPKPVERKHLTAEEKEKLNFITALELITQEALKEMQNKRYERKRRTTANPLYNFEPERKRPQSLLMNSCQTLGTKRRGRPPKFPRSPCSSHPGTPDSTDSGGITSNGHVKNGNDSHEDYCAVCGQSGQLLLCDTCSMVYHLQCLDPPLSEIPDGRWSCQKCQASGRSGWSADTLTIVNNFIASKTAKEEERRKLQRKNNELVLEKSQLENKNKHLNESILKQDQRKEELLEKHRLSQQKVETLKNFIKVIQSS